MFHVVVFEPEIPPNTGNLIRLAANTGCQLHLIKPLGFNLDRKSVRRAGLDYDELATVHVHYAAAQYCRALVCNRNRQRAASRRCAVPAGRCIVVWLGAPCLPPSADHP
jgi:tRNA(Leu) C34 or U34 (ribose-2'-O)-methylase TrmL